MPEIAAQYKAQAIEELTAKGISFPVDVDYYIAGNNTTAASTALILKQTVEDYLGKDFINFNIKTYVASMPNEVRSPRLASIFTTSWGADFGDPINFIGQEMYNDPNGFYTNVYTNANDATDEKLIAQYVEFTNMIYAAHAIVDDLDARYAAFADAEAYFIEHALAIPMSKNVTWELTKVNDYSKRYAAFGSNAYHYENWETSTELYTTEQYAEFKSAHSAE